LRCFFPQLQKAFNPDKGGAGIRPAGTGLFLRNALIWRGFS
jgi:hypothetical protein